MSVLNFLRMLKLISVVHNSLLAVITRRIVNVFLHPDIIYKWTRLYQLECEYLARTEAFTQKVVGLFHKMQFRI